MKRCLATAAVAALVLGTLAAAGGAAAQDADPCQSQRERVEMISELQRMFGGHFQSVEKQIAQQALDNCEAALAAAEHRELAAARDSAARELLQTGAALLMNPNTAPGLGGTIHANGFDHCHNVNQRYGSGTRVGPGNCARPTAPTPKERQEQARLQLKEAQDALEAHERANPSVEPAPTLSATTGISGYYIYWCVEHNGKSGNDNLSTNCATWGL